MSIENVLWGAPRIHGELLKLGLEVAQSTVARYMVQRHGPSSQTWRTFLRNHAPDVERLIGSIRRECLDRVVATGEAQLRRILRRYADYYNRARTHRSLAKDSPLHRPVQAIGMISSAPVLGGLHHVYARNN